MSATTLEPVRLVVWDLDETFWHGTLTEGGLRYRRDVHDTVIELARRGIVSSICSKNDMAQVRDVLEHEDIWDYFVFPSVNWDPKGPRLARLVEAVQLRPPTILFIDDNPANLGEAQHFVPGIQVADEKFVEGLLDNPLLGGKPDLEFERLRHYRLLEHRQTQMDDAGDNMAFLRDSNIVVTIEHDLEKHLDRAIELINRTNQLNFTKIRLSEDLATARAELRELLSGYTVQAGILHVRDRYGDYGYCGFYLLRSGLVSRELKHFCFSCRVLNMGVESWLYQRLDRPKLRVSGEVLTDIVGDRRAIDWIGLALPGDASDGPAQNHSLDYVYARGGCDMHALSHYFSMVAGAVHSEYNRVEAGTMLPLHHSVFARHAINGIPDAALRVFEKIGYRPDHFRSFLGDVPPDGHAIWVLSFWAEAAYALYEHNSSGLCVPISMRGHKNTLRDITQADPGDLGAEAKLLPYIEQHFAFTGMIQEFAFKENLRLILGRKTAGTRVFVLMAPDQQVSGGKVVGINKRKHSVNEWTASVARDFAGVELLTMADFATEAERRDNPNHFDRMVYFKVFQEIMRRVNAARVPAAAE